MKNHSLFQKNVQHFFREIPLKRIATRFTAAPAPNVGAHANKKKKLITKKKRGMAKINAKLAVLSEIEIKRFFCMRGFVDTCLDPCIQQQPLHLSSQAKDRIRLSQQADCQQPCRKALDQIYPESHIRIDLPACLRSDNTRYINSRMLFLSLDFVIKISVSL